LVRRGSTVGFSFCVARAVDVYMVVPVQDIEPGGRE
jgi:hypothetical protein